jgi:glycosyltransferase involved in cell wall biosynthesis
MRILFVTSTYWPAVRYGGTVTATRDLAEGLAALGHHIEVFTTQVDGRKNLDVAPNKPVNVNGVLVSYYAVPVLRRIYFSPAMTRGLFARAHEFDILTLHALYLFPMIAGSFAARRSGVPYIVFPHGMLVKELVAEKSKRMKQAWLWLFGRRLCEQAAAIRVTSEVEKEDVQRFGWALPPIINLPNAVREPDVPPSGGVSSDIQNLTRQQPLILFFGRVSWKKGLERLLRALALTRRGHLGIVGPDEENLTDKLRRLVEELGIATRVTILPRMVLGADKEHLFRAAKFFSLTSSNENFGNSVLEAMRRGIPVVVTPGVGASEHVTKAGAGVVVSGEPVRLSGAIDGLLSDEATLTQMGEAGADYAAKEVSILGVAQRFIIEARTVLYSARRARAL